MINQFDSSKEKSFHLVPIRKTRSDLNFFNGLGKNKFKMKQNKISDVNHNELNHLIKFYF